MVCRQCGSYYEADVKLCPVCGANVSGQAFVPEQPADTQEMHSAQPGWGFVRSPRWPKPTFDLNEVDNLPEPEEPAQYAAPSYTQPPYEEDYQQTDDGDDGYEGDYEDGYPPAEQPVGGFDPAGGRFSPQPLRDPAAPYGVQTVGSIGDYDSIPSPYQGGFGRAPKRTAVYNADDENDEYTQPARKRPAPIPKPVPSRGRSALPKRGRSSSLRGGRGSGNMLVLGAAGVLLVLLLVLGIVLVNRNYGGLGGFFRNVFGGSPILKDPVVTEGKNDKGEDCYFITVYARKGNQVTLKVGDQESSGTIGSSNQMLLRIPKVSFLPGEPVDGTTAQLVPDIRITTESEEVFQLDIDPITVQVPALAFELTEPLGESISVGRPNVKFAGTVDAGSSVAVGGQALTVEDGTFTGEYTLPDLGMHTLTIEARKNGYQIARKTVQVDYTNADANIEWTKSSLRAAEGDTATVKGTIDPGATLSVTGPSDVTVGAPSVNSATGFFSFTVQMAQVGHYELQVTVTKDGKATTGAVVVERAPDYAAYTAAVYRLDYDRMTKEPQHKASYKCIGKVAEVMQADPYSIAKLTTDKGDILFEYHGSAATIDLNDGKTYNVFGDYVGIDEATGLPRVYGWFITKG